MAPPDHIFIVRHGSRLDAADHSWNFSSSTPYDTPITYGGWTQSMVVGKRIAELLQTTQSDPTKKKKRFRVVIHTSPFLRCVQTSVAISAGLSSKPSLLANTHSRLSPDQADKVIDYGHGRKKRRTSSVGRKILLRIDAFLGEWLAIKYYELYQPPPGSVTMLTKAKANLVKPEDYSKSIHFTPRPHANSAPAPPGSTLLWGQTPRTDVLDPDSPLGLKGMADALPTAAAEIGAYDPPQPAFSISKNAPIPDGYVSHARDGCVVVDYQWDSTHRLYDWGDGGEFPEEWSEMHTRFGKGLQAMLDWYSSEEDSTAAVSTRYIEPLPDGEVVPVPDEDESDGEVEVETVLVIVSHGAGCNAMMGKITHQPMLMDVPISSLTMVSRDKSQTEAAASNGSAAGPSREYVKSDGKKEGRGDRPAPTQHYKNYKVRMLASTDHLRSSSSATPTLAPLRSASVATVARGAGLDCASVLGTSPGGSSIIDTLAGRSLSVSDASLSNSFPRHGGRWVLRNNKPVQISGPSSEASARPVLPALTASGLSRTPSVGLWTPGRSRKRPEAKVEEATEREGVVGVNGDS